MKKGTVRDHRRTAPFVSVPKLGRSRAPFTLASHPAIDPFMCGRNCITSRAAGLRDGRLGFVRKRNQQRPFMSAKASPDHKLNVLVDHEVGAAAGQMLLPVLPRRGAKDTGERDSLQRLTAMGSRASGSPLALFRFSSDCVFHLLSLSPKVPRRLPDAYGVQHGAYIGDRIVEFTRIAASSRRFRA